jgi:uncharacterized protein with von Willebrand factor type A (vWA) domain
VSARILYSRWDGSQAYFSLEAEQALDELSRFLMEGLDAQQSLEWMREYGFELAGMDFRVMGLEELLRELRKQARERMSQYNLDRAFDEPRRDLEEILDREEQTVRDQQGVESTQFSELRTRRERMPRRLSQALDSLRDYEWRDAEAEADYRELLEQLDEMRALEEFAARNRQHLQGPQSLSFEEALELMRQIEALSQMMRDLMEGNFQQLSLEQLRELLGDQAVQSILILRDLERTLERGGMLRQGEHGLELTPRAVRKLGELALDDIYNALKRGTHGGHESTHRGSGVVTPERSRPYQWGEPAHLDPLGTTKNALRRPVRRGAQGGVELDLRPEDLEVFDTDLLTETTTVLLLDMSWSMSWSGRWPAAKRVALALDQLIRLRYPRDKFFIVGFYTRARELRIHELPELQWNMSDPFTNLQDGLRIAQRLIDQHPSPNRQVIVITDGQPTAYFLGRELHVEWPSGFGGISPRANRETLREVRKVTGKGITINTFMLDDSAELVSFVEVMTRINRGRAFYTSPERLGQYIMVDYLNGKRRRIR